MLLHDLVETSRRVAASPGRGEKRDTIADLLRRSDPAVVEIVASFLTGKLRQGRIGIGWALLSGARPPSAPEEPGLTVEEVDRTLTRLAATAGTGSTAEKGRLLNDLLSRATGEEQDFLMRLFIGELRQGALEGLVTEAVARAAGLGIETVRRAVMAEGDLPRVARAALAGGEQELQRFAFRLYRPVQPMLAQTAESAEEALDRLGEAALEWKLDGARVQIHKGGDEVKVYSRRLREVTPAVPEIVEVARRLPARELILDGEAIALRPGGAPHPFQTTMRRFGRKLDVEALHASLPLSLFLFDLLYVDGAPVVDEPQTRRLALLREAVGDGGLLVPQKIVSAPEEAREFLARSLEAGHEGIMAKDPRSAYEAGNRGFAWLKLKSAHTLDLVVLAAEWGHGRRSGRLSNLHLGARDPGKNAFVMLGKTFKGMTDEMLAWQTEKLLSLEIARDAIAVHVRPELVVEVAFSDVQASPRYPGGVALRFARVKAYRPDKKAEDADTIDTVLAIHRRALRGG
jgi:DNA ligase-1